MKLNFLLSIGACIVFASMISCSSGKKAYEKGNYYESVMKSIQRLRSNPDHKKSQEALQSAYPLAVNTLQRQAENAVTSNSNFKWKNAIQAYTQINLMYEEIQKCPGCLQVVTSPKEFYSKIAPLKEKAADESYNAGIASLMKGTRDDAKAAYFNFLDADNYVPGYKDVVEYLSKAKFEATVKIVVEQIPVPSRYNLSGGFFQDKVEEFLHRNYTDQGFVKFYTPEEVQNIELPYIDQILQIKFDDFSVGNSRLSEKEETVSKDSVKLGDTKVGDKTLPVYGTVKAKLHSFKKEVISSGLLSMIIVDAKTKGILSHQKFSGEYGWVSQWANFNGDERALTPQQLKMCNSKETQPPGAQELFLEFTQPIYNQLIPAIKNFYKQY